MNGELDDADLAEIAALGIASEVAEAAFDIEENTSSITGDNITDDNDGDELELA